MSNEQQAAYVVLLEVRMLPLDAVVEDRDDDALAGEAVSPGPLHAHVERDAAA